MTQDDVIRFATQARLPHDYETQEPVWLDRLEAFAKLVEEHEREACAKECWKQMGMISMQPWTVNPYEECTKAIRARGQE